MALLGISWGVAIAGCGSPPPDLPTPLVLITVDTLRADHTSLHGYDRSTTPNLQRIASAGTMFSNAVSAGPCTVPAHTSIMTGRYPSFHSAGSYNGGYKVVPEEMTLAERLRDAGYATAAVVSNPVLNHRTGLDQGFDLYDDDLEQTEQNRDVAERQSDRAVDLAIDLVEGLEDRPFFLWLHLQDPHGPYTPPPDWEPSWAGDADGKRHPETELPLGDDHSGRRAIPRYQALGELRSFGQYADRYDAEISFMDAQLGRFLEFLAGRTTLDRGLVAITADHGEAFGEDDYYFSHCNSVGPDQVHVPLVLAGDGVPRGRIIPATVSNVSLFATFLEFAGLPARPEFLMSRHRELDERAAPPSLLRHLREQASYPAVLLESLNQIGIAHDGMLLRQDRVPGDDKEFWARGNPNTHSPWVPLGKTLQPLAEEPETAAEVDRPRFEEMLRQFDRAAALGSRQLDSIRQRTRLPRRLEQMLRALGYIG